MTDWINFSLFLKHTLIDDCVFSACHSKTKLFILAHPSPPTNQSVPFSPHHLSKWFCCPVAHIRNLGFLMVHLFVHSSFAEHLPCSGHFTKQWGHDLQLPRVHCPVKMKFLKALHPVSKTNSRETARHLTARTESHPQEGRVGRGKCIGFRVRKRWL